jgi:ribonucleoside-diphosphate reductase alpha chain
MQKSSGTAASTKILKTKPLASAKPEQQRSNQQQPKLTASQSVSMNRRYTQVGKNPLDAVSYVKANSKIKDTDGKTFFEMKDVEVPAGWSQLAIDILVSKYFRKAGVPGTGHEVSVRQVVRRLAHTLRRAGEGMGYFNQADAETFEAELSYMLVNQMGAFNSPVWFNLGLYSEYGIEGSGGNFAYVAHTFCFYDYKKS